MLTTSSGQGSLPHRGSPQPLGLEWRNSLSSMILASLRAPQGRGSLHVAGDRHGAPPLAMTVRWEGPGDDSEGGKALGDDGGLSSRGRVEAYLRLSSSGVPPAHRSMVVNSGSVRALPLFAVGQVRRFRHSIPAARCSRRIQAMMCAVSSPEMPATGGMAPNSQWC